MALGSTDRSVTEEAVLDCLRARRCEAYAFGAPFATGPVTTSIARDARRREKSAMPWHASREVGRRSVSLIEMQPNTAVEVRVMPLSFAVWTRKSATPTVFVCVSVLSNGLSC